MLNKPKDANEMLSKKPQYLTFEVIRNGSVVLYVFSPLSHALLVLRGGHNKKARKICFDMPESPLELIVARRISSTSFGFKVASIYPPPPKKKTSDQLNFQDLRQPRKQNTFRHIPTVDDIEGVSLGSLQQAAPRSAASSTSQRNPPHARPQHAARMAAERAKNVRGCLCNARTSPARLSPHLIGCHVHALTASHNPQL